MVNNGALVDPYGTGYNSQWGSSGTVATALVAKPSKIAGGVKIAKGIVGTVSGSNGSTATFKPGQPSTPVTPAATGTVLTDGLDLTQDQVNAIAASINATQVSEVPNGECFAGTCYPQDFLVGDTIITTAPNLQSSGAMGSLTDRDGNTWTLDADVPSQTNNGDWWWGGLTLNGTDLSSAVGSGATYCGYFIALRLLNDGSVWVESQAGRMVEPDTGRETPGFCKLYSSWRRSDQGPGPNNVGGSGGGTVSSSSGASSSGSSSGTVASSSGGTTSGSSGGTVAGSSSGSSSGSVPCGTSSGATTAGSSAGGTTGSSSGGSSGSSGNGTVAGSSFVVLRWNSGWRLKRLRIPAARAAADRPQAAAPLRQPAVLAARQIIQR